MTLKGIDGAKEIQTMMTNFRENPPKELGGFKVLAVRDYKADVTSGSRKRREERNRTSVLQRSLL